MPRYYRRRYSRTLVKPKKKWASNIDVYSNKQVQGNAFSAILVQNKTQANAPTPTIIKCGNFKVSMDIFFSQNEEVLNAHPVMNAYIMYVPEGWSNTVDGFNNLLNTHPEWIMAAKSIGSSWQQGTVFSMDSLNMSSRLKRNLNSGDGVVLYITSTMAVDHGSMNGTVRWWTCAN